MSRKFKIQGELDLKDNASKKVKGFADSTVSSFKKLIPVIGAGAIVAGFTALISKTVDYADKLGKLNSRLGVSTIELDKLRQIADLSGVRFEALSIGMQRLSRRIADASKGSGPAAQSLKELGLSAEALSKIPVDKQLRIVLKQLEGVENASEKVRLAFSLLDSEGVALIQMGKDLDENLSKVTSNFDDDKVKQAEDFNDSMTRMRETFAQLAVRVVPVLTKAMNALTTAWDYWEKKITGPTVEEKIAKLTKGIDELNKARERLMSEGRGEDDPFMKLNANYLATYNDELKSLQATMRNMPDLASSIDTSQIYDDNLKNEVIKTGDTTDKIKTLREKLLENLKNLEIDRMVFIGQNEQAEVQMVQNKYQKLLEEAQGNAEAIKLIEQGKLQELALINDKYRQDEAQKRLADVSNRMQMTETLAGEERRKQSETIKKVVDDFKEGEKQKLEVANKTRMFFVDNFSDAFASVISGSKKAGDAFKDMVGSMLQQLAKMAAQKALMQMFSMGGAGGTGMFASLGSIFGFAKGGKVKGNEPIVVGEKGPEIFTPKSSGQIIPNHKIEDKYASSSSLKSGDNVKNTSNLSVNVNMNASGSNLSDPATANKVGSQIAKMVKAEVMNIISDNQRYGGLLYTGRRRTA